MSYRNFESTTVMVVLATISVIIRFVSKSFTKARFSLDDYWISFSLVAFWTYVSLHYWVIFKLGGGLDMRKVREMDRVEISLYLEVRKSLD